VFNRKKGVSGIVEVNRRNTAMVDGPAMNTVGGRRSVMRMAKTRHQLTGIGACWKRSPLRSSGPCFRPDQWRSTGRNNLLQHVSSQSAIYMAYNPPNPPCQGGVVAADRFSPPLIRGRSRGFVKHCFTPRSRLAVQSQPWAVGRSSSSHSATRGLVNDSCDCPGLTCLLPNISIILEIWKLQMP